MGCCINHWIKNPKKIKEAKRFTKKEIIKRPNTLKILDAESLCKIFGKN